MLRDIEMLRRWRPEPPTPFETEALNELAVGDFEVYRNKLELICWEAYQTFSRMGVSPMIEAGDSAIGIYTRQGDLSVGIMGTQLHLVNASIGIKWTMKYFYDDPSVGIREGDMFYVNDALYGGIHNSDQILYAPVFHGRDLIAWVAAASHETETGATEPGGNPPSGRSRYDDGLLLSPIRIGEAHILRTDLLEMMENRVRDPRMQTLDIKARAAACSILERRIHEIIEKKSVRFLIGTMRRTIDEGTALARKKLSEMNDGIYRSSLFLDGAGQDKYGLIECRVEVEKRGERATLRFRGSPRVVQGNFNVYPHQMIAMFACYLFQFFFHEIPATTGLYEPFDFEFQEGSFFYADLDDCTSIGGTGTTAQVSTGAHDCFEKMKFGSPYHDFVTASWSGMSGALAIAGKTQDGRAFAAWDQGQPNGAGAGARWDLDGQDAVGFIWCGIGEFLDTENIEEDYPVVAFFRSQFWCDAAGNGKQRGGRSMCAMYRVRGTPDIAAVSIAGFSGRPVKSGLFGGYPARPLGVAYIRNNNLDELIAEGRSPRNVQEAIRLVKGDWTVRHVNSGLMMLKEGDAYIAMASSGPGYGDALERDPELVTQDIKDSSISHDTARRIYKVVCEEDGSALDAEATARARDEERQARLAVGKPWDEWIKTWETRRPPESVLSMYGEWPHGTPRDNLLSHEPLTEFYIDEDVREGRRPPGRGITLPDW